MSVESVQSAVNAGIVESVVTVDLIAETAVTEESVVSMVIVIAVHVLRIRRRLQRRIRNQRTLTILSTTWISKIDF